MEKLEQVCLDALAQGRYHFDARRTWLVVSLTASTKHPHDVFPRQRTPRLKCVPLMAYRLSLIAVLLLAFADPVLANWWIVRASDEKCLVVDIEPTGNDKTVTKVGKDVYQTPEEAEADVKRLCQESKAEDRPPRDTGKAK